MKTLSLKKIVSISVLGVIIYIGLSMYQDYSGNSLIQSSFSGGVLYDAFDSCKSVNREEVNRQYTELTSNLKLPIERIVDPSVEMWFEKLPQGLPETLKIERSFVRSLYTSEINCKENAVTKVNIEFMASEKAIEEAGPWYRARYHKNSCDLVPANVDILKHMILPGIAYFSKEANCSVELNKGVEDRNLLALNCGDNSLVLVNQQEGCRYIVSHLKSDLDPIEYEQYGW